MKVIVGLYFYNSSESLQRRFWSEEGDRSFASTEGKCVERLGDKYILGDNYILGKHGGRPHINFVKLEPNPRNQER